MSLWFGASAVAPALASQWGFTTADAARLTLAVQLGFVAGTLVERARATCPTYSRRAGSSRPRPFWRAMANAAFALARARPGSAIALRFATGFFLAGVYPPGMKIMASWFSRGPRDGARRPRRRAHARQGLSVPRQRRRERGLARQPARAFGSRGRRRRDRALSSGTVRSRRARRRSTPKQIVAGLPQPRRAARELRLLRPHVGALRDVDVDPRHDPRELRRARVSVGRWRRPASFLVIGAGAVGCVAAGLAADRVGRTAVASAAMAVSAERAAFSSASSSEEARPAPRGRGDLGSVGRRRLRAVLGVRDRARGPAVRRHRADAPDLPRVPAHDRVDRARREAPRGRRLALGVRRAGARAPRSASSRCCGCGRCRRPRRSRRGRR